MFMLLSEFSRRHFSEGSRPSLSTLRRWIERGLLPGRRFGTQYYVDYSLYRAQGDELVEKVLNDESSSS